MADSKKYQNKLGGLDLILILLIAVFSLGGIYFFAKNQSFNQPTSTNKSKQKSNQKVVANPKFEECLSSDKYGQIVDKSSQLAQDAGVRATPTSVVYDLKTGRKFVIIGAQPYEKVKSNFSKFIKGAKIDLPKGQTFNLSKVVRPDSTKDHWYGNKKARYVIIEYSDFECPYCRRFHSEPQQLLTDFKDKIAWVYRHVPLTSIHPNSRMEAIASECAAKLGGNDGFWKYTNKLFEKTKSNGRSFTKEDLIGIANQFKLK